LAESSRRLKVTVLRALWLGSSNWVGSSLYGSLLVLLFAIVVSTALSVINVFS
jgi:hypothetical protein